MNVVPEDAAEVTPPGAGELILVVEDDADVRAHTCEVLEELGYRVRPVVDGVSAIAALEGAEPIDLVFTDVILAGALNGRDIAERAHLVRPSLPVLFTSGYAREAIIKNGRIEDGMALLPKPFTMAQLAGRVRTLLDKPPASRRSAGSARPRSRTAATRSAACTPRATA